MRIRRLDRVSYSILYRYLSVVVLALLFLLLYHQRKATKIRYATQAVYTYLYMWIVLDRTARVLGPWLPSRRWFGQRKWGDMSQRAWRLHQRGNGIMINLNHLHWQKLTEDDVCISNVIVFRCIVTCMIMYICERNIRNIYIRRNKAKDKQQAKEAREERHVWTQHIYSVYIYGTTASLFPGRAQRLLRDPYHECQSQWTISNLPKLELKNTLRGWADFLEAKMWVLSRGYVQKYGSRYFEGIELRLW